jgi:hypothetical protein
VQQEKEQFAVVNKEGEIEALILTRGEEFYCYERLEDSPRNHEDVRRLYPASTIIKLQLSQKKGVPSGP